MKIFIVGTHEKWLSEPHLTSTHNIATSDKYPQHMFTYKNKEIIHLDILLNSFPASVGFCRLLITFANSLDPDQARQNVGPDLDPNCLTL